MKRRMLGLLVASIMVISVISSITVSAETTIVTRQEAINWLYSVEGTSVGTPYGYYGECASLGYRYYEKLLGRGIFADSGGTGHGKEYDDNNHSINLGWSKETITSSTQLQEGDVIVSNYEPYGHVAIFLSGTATSATLIHQANSDYFGGKVKRTYGDNLVGRTYVRPMWKNSSKPTNCTITANDTFVQTGQSVTFTFTQSGASYWYCDIENESGVRQHCELVTGKYSYTYTFNKEGKYKVFLKAANDAGWTEPYVWITVSNQRPTNVSITADKTYVRPNESVTFDFTLEQAAYWYFVIHNEDGSDHLVELATGKYSKTYAFDKEGKYEVFLSAANDNGWVEPSVWITVSSQPEKPKLNDMQKHYHSDQNIVFEWDKTGATTHYNLYIHKKNNEGVYQSYENTFYAEPGMTRSLEVGEYFVFLQSTNSNAWDSEHNTWKFTNSELYYFTVSDGYVPTATTEWNGHTYSLYDYSLSWKEAKVACEEIGGHLVTINTEEENDMISSFVKQGKSSRYYLGGTDEEKEGEWKWVTGEAWLFDHLWGNGEPTNSNLGEHYLEIYGQWNDTANVCETNGGFICEIEMPCSDSTVTQTNTTHTVKTTLYNIEDTCEVLVAGYKEGKFVTCQSFPYDQAQLTFTLEGDFDEIKVMAWGDLSSMNSLCSAEVIPSSEWIVE